MKAGAVSYNPWLLDMDGRDDAGHYVLGHSDQELARLERQAQIFLTETRELLLRAGLSTGMNVLDVGSGAGDVALLAAGIVGPTGSVMGFDRAATALPMARARAARAGYDWLTFEDADVYSYETERRFDAVIGRFLLMHLPDPVGGLRRLTHFLKPGGVIAFVEMDIDETRAVPEIPLLRRCVGWISDTYRKVGVDPNMGEHLYATYRAAGLNPSLAGMTRVVGQDDRMVFGFAAQTLASLLPAMEKHGIATATEVDVATIAERLHEEAMRGDRCILMPRLMGAWAQTPV